MMYLHFVLCGTTSCGGVHSKYGSKVNKYICS